jgi:hypothetical protein
MSWKEGKERMPWGDFGRQISRTEMREGGKSR